MNGVNGVNGASAGEASGADEAPLWWQRGVVYQIYPRSFQDTTGDGVGDLRGILSRLDYLAWLGVDAIWISPFYRSPMKDFGYDVSSYTDVDPLFGDLATCDELIRRAHDLGMHVIIDFVPSHTSEEHPWFVESRSSRASAKRAFYVWADARDDGSPPSNWLSVFGGSAWQWDEATGQFYLHSFLKEQPDLNWRNPEVRAAILDAMKFWLDRGIDGFRLDAVLQMMKDPEMRDNPPRARRGQPMHRPMGAYDSQEHVYDRGHPDVHGVFRAIRRLLDGYGQERPRMAVGELHVFDWPAWASYYGADLDELHLPFNFGLLKARWEASSVRAVVDGLEAALPLGAWPNYVLGNHDEPRIATRIGAEQARVAAMLVLTLRGTPTLYYGDELGMRDVPIPPEQIQDPWEKLTPGLGVGRDPARTPMPWTSDVHGGFCPPTVSPWLPLGADLASVNVAALRADPRSTLSFVRALLALRRATPALHRGSYRAVDGAPDCFVFVREHGAARYVVALNLGGEARDVALAGFDRGRVAVSTHMDREGDVSLASFPLRANEGCVIELR